MHPPQGDPKSDAELISSVRLGDPSAFGVLYERHAAPATAMARLYATDDFSADDLVSEAFERTFAVLRAGGGPDVSFRAYLYTAVRRLAFEVTERNRRTQTTDDFSPWEAPLEQRDAALDSFEGRIVTAAFASLPERWQAVLWYLEVEGMRPPEVAPLLGLTANGVSALAYRAREGLREAYLQEHISTVPRDAECESLRGRLGAFANGSLSARDSTKVRAHASSCPECSAILAELRDEGRGLRAFVAPFVVGGAVAAGLWAGSGAGDAASALPLAAVPRGVAWAAPVGAVAGVAAIAGVAIVLALTMGGSSAPLDESAERPDAVGPAAVDAAPTGAPSPEPSIPPSLPPTPPLTPPPAPPAGPPTTPSSTPAPTATATPTPTPTPTAAETRLSLALPDLGDLVLGREGVVGVTVAATGRAATAVGLDVLLPAGVVLDASRSSTIDPAWSCAPIEAIVRCSATSLPPDRSTVVLLPVVVSMDAALGASPTAIVSARGAPPATAASPSAVVAAGMAARFVADGRHSVVLAGSSFLSCDPAQVGCDAVRSRGGSIAGGDNHQWPLVVLDGAGTGAASSIAAIELPSAADVVFAGLYWSAAVPTGATDAELGVIQLRAPGGSSHEVVAARTDRSVIAGAAAYQSYSDVTSIVASAGAGAWAVSGALVGPGAAVAPGQPVTSGSYAGWSLVVVYADPTVAEGRVTVFDGLVPVTAASPADFAIAGLDDRETTIGLVAWEGDAGLVGDRLEASGAPLARAAWGADVDNALVSAALGSVDANTFGVDVGMFLPLRFDSARLRLSAVTALDQFALGVVTVDSR